MPLLGSKTTCKLGQARFSLCTFLIRVFRNTTDILAQLSWPCISVSLANCPPILRSWCQTIEMLSQLTSYTNTQLDSIITKGPPYPVNTIHYRGWFLLDPRNFTQFYSTKSERDLNLRKEYDNQMEYRKHLQAFIDRWRYNANRGMCFACRLVWGT